MVKVKDITLCEEAAFSRTEEVFLCKAFSISTTIHITFYVDTVVHRQEGKDVPAHVQLVIQFSGIGHHLIHLRIHIIRVAALVHVANIIEVEQSQVQSLGPRFKFRLSQFLCPTILSQTTEGFQLEHAEGTQLIFQDRVIGIRGVGSSSRSAFGFMIGIAKCRSFQEHLGKDLSHLGFASLVILAIANAKALFTNIRLIALGFCAITKFLFTSLGIHLQFVLEHVAGHFAEVTLIQEQIISGLHVGAFRRAMIA